MVRLKEKKAEHFCCAYLRHKPESAVSCAFMRRGDMRNVLCHSELFFRHSEAKPENPVCHSEGFSPKNPFNFFRDPSGVNIVIP